MTRIAWPTQTRTDRFLGEAVRIDLRDDAHPDLIAMAMRAASAELLRIDRRFSRDREDSEVSLLSTHQAQRDDLSGELNAVLDACTAMSLLTRGAFDISRGCPDEEIDVSGYVRGWGLDRAARVLIDHGMQNFCLGMGMDVLVSGRAAADRPWRAGVRDGRPGEPVRAVVTLTEDQPFRAISTVADPYDRGGSTTVISCDLVQAAAFSRAAAEWGDRGTPWTHAQPAVEVLRVDAAGRISGTRGLPALLHW